MNHEQIQASVHEVLKTLLQQSFDEDSVITRDNTPSWNSLKHIEVMFALEDEFNIEFSEYDLAHLDSASMIVEKIQLIQNEA